MTSARPFQDRAQREAVSFPMRFSPDGAQPILGTCENLSESGLLALFAIPPEIWVEGTIDLEFGTGLLGIRGRVARLVGSRAGFAFQSLGEEHRSKIRELLQTVQQSSGMLNHL